MSEHLRALSPAVMEKAVSVWKRELANGLTPEGALVIVLSEAMPVHAHELAEKIREDLEVTGDWTCCVAARGASANLIDPEVSSNG